MNQLPLAPGIPVDFPNCDLEPIHIPSLIQPHGMLLAARVADLRMVYTSENALLFLGLTPAFILGGTLVEVLGPEAAAAIGEAVGDQQNVPKSIRNLSFPVCPERRFEVTAHHNGGLLYVELEVATGEPRLDLLAARLKGAAQDLGVPRTLQGLCATIPLVIRRLTGYDRVFVYRFHPDGHGEIVGEDKEAEMEPFLSLHYPGTDIPRQARELYLRQRFRMIVDVNYVPAPLLGNPELIGTNGTDEPLDMTFCSLRSNSPMHLEYMRIMGVGASLGMSIVVSGKLWGLIVGHHRTSKHLGPGPRILCDLLGELISLLVGAADAADAAAGYREKKSLLDLLSASMEKNLPAGSVLTGNLLSGNGQNGPESNDNGLAGNAATLLALVHADGAIARLGGHLTLLGNTPAPDDSAALFDAFHTRLLNLQGETLSSDRVGELLPAFAHLASQASGALLVPFQEASDGILWLRGEVVQKVRWAGPPDASMPEYDTSVRLGQRRSFAVWEQVRHGRSPPWLTAETEAALGFQRTTDHASRVRHEANLVRLHTDQLTGLGSRLKLLERLSKWRARGPRAPAALLFLDLDDFRVINERHGHPVGDEFLRRVGARLGFVSNWKHLVARLGGDEFAIFCEDTSLGQAEQLSTIILAALAEPFEMMGKTLSSTASIGIAPVDRVFDSKSSDPLRVADSAMYVAKHKGGNRYSIVESREQAEILRATIAEEVVARRLAADELTTSYARFHSVLESTSDNVVTIGSDWTILYGNEKARETLPELKIGASYWTCFASVLGTPTELHLRAAMSERTEQHYEVFFAPYRRWYRAKAFPVAEGISLFFSDITEERENEEQLALEQILREKRIEALTHMAAGLAHEISNPLAIIHGLASDLVELAQANAERPVGPHEVRAACKSILKTAERASNILRGLRGFARESAQDPMELASIYEIVEQCTELQQPRLERHDIGLTIAIDPGIPRFLCREVQIGQILTNLFNNAFDAISQSEIPSGASGRWIEIGAGLEANRLCVDVSDSGPGIEDHFKAHLMEPFFTTKELGLGMGIGLSLSRAIAQDHGGTLTLLKETERTTFRLTLPLVSPPAAAHNAAIAQPEPRDRPRDWPEGVPA
jgi:diguanylate cyclase (GGDEF)-like protein